MGKFVLIAVFALYPKDGSMEVERVETWGVFKTLAACKKETEIPFGLIPPGLVFLDCVPLKIKP